MTYTYRDLQKTLSTLSDSQLDAPVAIYDAATGEVQQPLDGLKGWSSVRDTAPDGDTEEYLKDHPERTVFVLP